MEKKPKHMTLPSEEEVAAERERLKRQRQARKAIRAVIFALIIVAAAAAVIATIFLPVLEVSGSSMEPTLVDGDVIVLFNSKKLETGDLIGFYHQNKLLLKRVIAGPGDIVDIDDEGNVYVNDELLDEPYVTEKALGDTDRDYPYQVPDGCYFVMGDNRSTSIDSRSSAIGCVAEDQIIGRIILRLWPLSRLTIF